MRREDGCRKLNTTLSRKTGLKIHVLQGIKFLIPLHRLSLNRNACCLLRYFLIGYSDEELILQAKPFRDLRDIMRPED